MGSGGKTKANSRLHYNYSTEFPVILSSGAAYGNHYTTEQMLDAFVQQQKATGNCDDALLDFASRVFEKCGYEGHSVALDLHDVFRRFSRNEYLQHRAKNLTSLAERASEQALERWGRPRSEITHLFWGTMTGAMQSPTIDIELVQRLGLHSDVERTSIEGMGCLTGFRLLNLARQVVAANPSARVLVIAADLRSALGNSLPDKPTRADIVSAALFRDGASAVVVSPGDDLRAGENPCYEIIEGLSRIADGTRHLVQYSEADGGAIRLHLDRKLPDHIGLAEPDFVATLLEKGKLAYNNGSSLKDAPAVTCTKKKKRSFLDDSDSDSDDEDCNFDDSFLGEFRDAQKQKQFDMDATETTQPCEDFSEELHEEEHMYRETTTDWVQTSTEIPPVTAMDILCHTGGPRVLKMVGQSLGVNETSMSSSWHIMTSHGNLSGASNLAVLDHHNQLPPHQRSEWAVALSMGPGICLEGVLLRDARQRRLPLTTSVPIGIPPVAPAIASAWTPKPPKLDNQFTATAPRKKVVHIVGAGIAGLTLAAALDPQQFEVRVFESSLHVGERGYGMAFWPSTMRILRDAMGVTGLDLSRSETMVVHRASCDDGLDVKVGKVHPDKGFMKRSHLLERIKARVEERHPGCISTGHSCIRVRFQDDCSATATYETKDDSYSSEPQIVSHSCDLLVGADGVNSAVRRYVATLKETKSFGHMTAYRFLVPNPSKELLQQTANQWNMSLGKHIHSPCYRISSEDNSLNVVVLEYDGKTPGPPRQATLDEVLDVALRSKLGFVVKMLQREQITDLACYSTYHVDCEPWVQPCAAIIGDAAHAFGPLTAKMANLAINDAHTLASMLNESCFHQQYSQEQILRQWQDEQRPKFEVTRTRTLRHLQLYSPQFRGPTSFLWKVFPKHMLSYFGSIFAYDYEVYDRENKGLGGNGIVGNASDPLLALIRRMPVFFFGLLLAVAANACLFLI